MRVTEDDGTFSADQLREATRVIAAARLNTVGMDRRYANDIDGRNGPTQLRARASLERRCIEHHFASAHAALYGNRRTAPPLHGDDELRLEQWSDLERDIAHLQGQRDSFDAIEGVLDRLKNSPTPPTDSVLGRWIAGKLATKDMLGHAQPLEAPIWSRLVIDETIRSAGLATSISAARSRAYEEGMGESARHVDQMLTMAQKSKGVLALFVHDVSVDISKLSNMFRMFKAANQSQWESADQAAMLCGRADRAEANAEELLTAAGMLDWSAGAALDDLRFDQRVQDASDLVKADHRRITDEVAGLEEAFALQLPAVR